MTGAVSHARCRGVNGTLPELERRPDETGSAARLKVGTIMSDRQPRFKPNGGASAAGAAQKGSRVPQILRGAALLRGSGS